jgi:hypothetical protein
MEERDEPARLLRLRDVAAIALKASFALQIAIAGGGRRGGGEVPGAGRSCGVLGVYRSNEADLHL